MRPSHPIVRTWRQFYHNRLLDDGYMLIDRAIRCQDDIQAKIIVNKGRQVDLVSYLIEKHRWRLLWRVLSLRPDALADNEDYLYMAKHFQAPHFILRLITHGPPTPCQEPPRRMCTRSVTHHNKRPHAMRLRPRK